MRFMILVLSFLVLVGCATESDAPLQETPVALPSVAEKPSPFCERDRQYMPVNEGFCSVKSTTVRLDEGTDCAGLPIPGDMTMMRIRFVTGRTPWLFLDHLEEVEEFAHRVVSRDRSKETVRACFTPYLDAPKGAREESAVFHATASVVRLGETSEKEGDGFHKLDLFDHVVVCTNLSRENAIATLAALRVSEDAASACFR